MRAWQTVKTGRPAEALVLNTHAAIPEAGPGMLRLEVCAAGIGLPDALMCLGSYPLTPALPFTQGQEAVGRIDALGPGVRDRSPGQRVVAVTGFVAGHGGFADRCLALDDFCLPVPEEMSNAEAAAFLIPMHTAYIALQRRARLAAGETLLVLGAAGGTGSAAVQVGNALGARVIAVAGGLDKTTYCARIGAEHVIDYRDGDLCARVLELTAGKGADVVYDPVGGATFAEATRCVAHEGRLLVVGFASGHWGEVQVPHLVNRNYSVMGVIPSGYDRAFREAAHARLLAWWRQGTIRTMVDEIVAFEHLPSALEKLLDRRVTGKLVLAVSSEAQRSA